MPDSSKIDPQGVRQAYRLDASTLGTGGFAEVFPATHKPSGRRVALKRLKQSFDPVVARERMRREIEVQAVIQHPNIMPVVDADPEHEWFCMPIAVGDLEKLRTTVGPTQLPVIVQQIGAGLAHAHASGYIHRDVTPRNILLLQENPSPLWVVADWGVLRQPQGETTMGWTQTGQTVGVPAYAAPECQDSAHHADQRADIYSIGRVVARVVTGQQLRPNIPLLPDGPWRHFVRVTTAIRREDRPGTVAEMLKLIPDVEAFGAEPPLAGAIDLSRRAKAGDQQAALELLQLASANPHDPDVLFDHVPKIPSYLLNALFDMHGSLIVEVSTALSKILQGDVWGRRDFNEANTHLGWIRSVAQVAGSKRQFGALEDVSDALFQAEATWSRFKSRTETQRWLDGLNADLAPHVARALSRHSACRDWLSKDGWSPSAASAQAIRQQFVQ